jgi:hypothetical protein
MLLAIPGNVDRQIRLKLPPGKCCLSSRTVKPSRVEEITVPST